MSSLPPTSLPITQPPPPPISSFKTICSKIREMFISPIANACQRFHQETLRKGRDNKEDPQHFWFKRSPQTNRFWWNYCVILFFGSSLGLIVSLVFLLPVKPLTTWSCLLFLFLVLLMLGPSVYRRFGSRQNMVKLSGVIASIVSVGEINPIGKFNLALMVSFYGFLIEDSILQIYLPVWLGGIYCSSLKMFNPSFDHYQTFDSIMQVFCASITAELYHNPPGPMAWLLTDGPKGAPREFRPLILIIRFSPLIHWFFLRCCARLRMNDAMEEDESAGIDDVEEDDGIEDSNAGTQPVDEGAGMINAMVAGTEMDAGNAQTQGEIEEV